MFHRYIFLQRYRIFFTWKKNVHLHTKKGVTFFYITGINQHPRHQNYGIAQEEL